MTAKSKSCDMVARVGCVLLAIAFVGMAGCWWLDRYVDRSIADIGKLAAVWDGDQIHVYSSIDGPWYVTHLVVYGSDGYWRAMAQLPKPVTIVDSSGYYFDLEQINSFDWKIMYGDDPSPPKVGEKVGVFHIFLDETERPPRSDGY